MAAGRILDRAIGKAPMQIDVSALRHDQIVYQSVEEIRAELVRRIVPLLIDHLPNAESEPPTQSENTTSTSMRMRSGPRPANARRLIFFKLGFVPSIKNFAEVLRSCRS